MGRGRVAVIAAIVSLLGFVGVSWAASPAVSEPAVGSCANAAIAVHATPGIGPVSAADQNVSLSLSLWGEVTSVTGGGVFGTQSTILPGWAGGRVSCVIPGLPHPHTTLKSVTGNLVGNINCVGQQTPTSYPPHGQLTFTMREKDPRTGKPYKLVEYVNLSRDEYSDGTASGPFDQVFLRGIATGGGSAGADVQTEGLLQVYDDTNYHAAVNCQDGADEPITDMFLFTDGTSTCTFGGTFGPCGDLDGGVLHGVSQWTLPIDFW